jgi:hypothetical protein
MGTIITATMKIKTRADARREIEDAIQEDGMYTHNIISCVLRMVATRWGYKDCNKLIDRYELTKRYGIHKRREEADL